MKVIKKIIKDHVEYRKQILKLAKSDLIRTYKGASLGWAWAIIRPTIMIVTYYAAFSFGLRVGKPIGGVSFFLWLIAGIAPWFYISAMYTGGAYCIRKYSYLVTKIRYPVSTIPTVVNLSQMITHIAVVLIVMVIYIIGGKMPDVYWLQLPFYTLLMFLLSTAWSLLAGIVSTINKDIAQLIRASTMVLFWMSAILYDASRVNNVIFKKVLAINPITYIVDGYRNVFVYKVWFWERWAELRNFGIAYVVMVLLALYAYKKLVKEIPDVL